MGYKQKNQIRLEKWNINTDTVKLCLRKNGDFQVEIEPVIMDFDINVFPNLELLKLYLDEIMYVIVNQFPLQYLIDLHIHGPLYQKFKMESIVFRKKIWKELVEEYLSRWEIRPKKWGINPDTVKLCLRENGDFQVKTEPAIMAFKIDVFPSLEFLKLYLEEIMLVAINQIPLQYLIDLYIDGPLYQKFKDDSLVNKKRIWKELIKEYLSRWVFIMDNNIQMDYSKEPFT